MLADLARLGEKTQVNLKIISARDGSTLSVFVDRVKGDEEIADSLARGAQQMSKEIRSLLRSGVAAPVAVEADSPPARGASRFWWAPTANPGALAVADLNHDSKPDIAVANFGSGTVTILLNASPDAGP